MSKLYLVKVSVIKRVEVLVSADHESEIARKAGQAVYDNEIGGFVSDVYINTVEELEDDGE